MCDFKQTFSRALGIDNKTDSTGDIGVFVNYDS